MSQTLTSSTASQHQQPLQSVLVVADPSIAGKIIRGLQETRVCGQTHTVSDYLLALGQVAHDPPQILIGALDAMMDPMEETISALRKISPVTRLVAMTNREHENDARQAVEKGFHDYLIEPFSVAELAETITRIDAETYSAKVKSHLADTGPASSRSKVMVANDEREPTAADQPVCHGTELGDVDLVRQMTDDCRQLPTLAMNLIENQSGLAGVGIAETIETVSAGHLSTPVQTSGCMLGYLHAPPPVTMAQLEPWAKWLAEWIRLQRHIGQLWDMALRDELTGVWNRRYFDRFLNKIINRAAHERFRVTLLVFDIDDFKMYNDRYGHAAGDEILSETARLMQSVVRDHDVVARIGGDEFGVIFWDDEAPRQPNSQHPITVRIAAERFQKEICAHKFPKLLEDAPGTLTISGGLAGFPWDGRVADELLAKADQMALESKRNGKNVITFGPGAHRAYELDWDSSLQDGALSQIRPPQSD